MKCPGLVGLVKRVGKTALREGGTDTGIRLGCSGPHDSGAMVRGSYAEGRAWPPRPAAPPPVRRARGQGKAPPPPLKMEVTKRAPPARLPHGRAATNFAGASWGSDPGIARAATHPQTGSPGWRSSGTWTEASWWPAQPRPNHINRGGGGSSGSDYRRRVRRENAAYRARLRARLPLTRSFSSSLNRPEPNARALPQQHTHVTARGRVCAASRRRLPARNARGCVGGTFYFKGKKRRRPRPPEKSRPKLAAS